MVNVIPPYHVDDVPVVESDQHDDVLVVSEPVLVDEDEDPEEDEFEEEEDPQEEEDDIIHEVGESSTAPLLREDSDGLLPGLLRGDINALFGQMASLSRLLCSRETTHALVEKKEKAKEELYGKLILDLSNEVRYSVEQGTAVMEKLVEKIGNAKDKVECKKLKKELEEARFSNTFLRMQNERVERDLYWTRVRAHEFYQEMIRRGFVFEERPNEAINVSIEDEKSPSSEPIMPPKSALMTQAAIRRMIKENFDAAIAAERARHANVGNDARGSGPVRGQDAAPVAHEGLETVNLMPWTDMKHLMTAEFFPIEEIQRMEHKLWNLKVKEYNIVAYTQ
nr:hypothetical protein [Tanacetum cinerariifolium]